MTKIKSLRTQSLVHALPITSFILYLISRWFAVSDRYRLFLYDHDMGPLVPDTSPFSRVTSSRYWMAGLVAAGAVMLLYTAANWILGRMDADYQPPPWRQVWLPCAAVLLVAVPVITMNANHPTLPLVHAVRVTLATLVGLALALLPAPLASRHPFQLALLTVDGLALMAVSYLGVTAEYLTRAITHGNSPAAMVILVPWGGGSLLLLLANTALMLWQKFQIPSAGEQFLAVCCATYLLLPFMHHIAFTDNYFYITDSDNFLARNPLLQLLSWLLTAVLAWLITRWRRRLLLRQFNREVFS